MNRETVMTQLEETGLLHLGHRIDQPLKVENDHSLMTAGGELQLISTVVFNESLSVVTEDDRKVIKIASDTIDMRIDDKGKVSARLKGVLLTGMKRFAVYKKLISHATVLDIRDDQVWTTYTVVWNNRLYDIGWMNDNMAACYMRRKLPREYTDQDYYKAWKKNSNWAHSYNTPVTPQITHEVYGDQASGLGSIYIDRVHEELDQMIDYVRALLDDDLFSDKLDEFRELLDISEG